MTDSYPAAVSLDEIRADVQRRVQRREARTQRYQKRLSLLDSSSHPNVSEMVSDCGEVITKVDGDIPIDLPIQTGDRFLFISYDQSALTHGLHKYPAKFFPELPRWLIQKYSREGDLVLDPFSGSGTTNLEAKLLKRHSIGVDVEPFSRFLAKVKTTPLPEGELHRAQGFLLRACENFRPSAVCKKTDLPEFPYRDNWFNRGVLLELAHIKKAIDSMEFDESIKNFFLVCFSSIIRSVSNADDNCTRTVIRKRLNKKVEDSDALRRFAQAVLTNVPKMVEFSRICPKRYGAEFPDGMDARSTGFADASFDLAVTSPPYANAVDYPRTHQLEIYWLGLAQGSLTPLKKKHVGTESVSSEKYKDLHRIGVESADRVISRIYEQDPRRAYIAFRYLEDMRKNLEEVHRVLKPGAVYVVVVGNNRIRGELFENWRYILRLAEIVGFKVDRYFGSEIIKHFIKVPREERIDTDWVLVLER